MLADISKSKMCPWSNSEHSLQLHKQSKLICFLPNEKENTFAHTKMDLLLCDGSIIHNNASSNVSVLLISQCIYDHIAKVF